ncbi:MAG TPA: hypothetical protein VFZ35_07825 [Sphingomicrobium sp.]
MLKAYAFCTAAVAALAAAGAAVQATPPSLLPTGAKIEASGYWTIASAPDSPPGPPLKRGPQSEKTFYAELAGVSNAEAQRRLEAQEKLRPEFERLMATIRTKERGNYTDVELIHRPDWAYLIYFKRQPAATLAKYTKNPRFQARSASYTEAELIRITKPWIDRLESERLFTGYGMNARHGTADIDMIVSEGEFAAIARRNGWGTPPATVNLKFSTAPVGPAVNGNVAQGIRIFPRSDRNLGMTNQAALGGRLVLRDGCLYLIGFDRTEKLAYFGREVGVGLDRQGYLSLHRRNAERTHLGRVGETFTWGGPIGIDEKAPMVKQLRAQCGSAPLVHVGVPESSAMFSARYGLPRGPREPLVKPGGVPIAPPPAPPPPRRN